MYQTLYCRFPRQMRGTLSFWREAGAAGSEQRMRFLGGCKEAFPSIQDVKSERITGGGLWDPSLEGPWRWDSLGGNETSPMQMLFSDTLFPLGTGWVMRLNKAYWMDECSKNTLHYS